MHDHDELTEQVIGVSIVFLGALGVLGGKSPVGQG